MQITVDRASSIPVYLQIRNQIREMILSSDLPVGFRLPPERKLAETLGVNRSTVVSAYRELEADALIRSHVGRGTSVHPWAPEGSAGSMPQVDPIPWHQLFREGAARALDPLTRDLMELAGRPDVISFAAGIAAPEMYPVDALRKIQDELMADRNRGALQHSPTEGHHPLRESISRLMGSRGIEGAPEEVMVLSGSMQGLDLACRAFLDPGDVVVVEEPTFFCALQVFEAAGARVLGVPMDEGGMRVDALEPLLARYRPKLLYTQPTFQNPSGVTMGLERRRKLLELAYRYQLPILEDDPYGELRYEGDPLPPLKALDPHGYVLYLSTFSKLLFPGLRVGWLAAPRAVIRQFALAKQSVDLHTNSLSQWLLDGFLRRGLLDEHLPRVRAEYARRRDAMLEALDREAAGRMIWNRPRGGFYLWCHLLDDLSSARLLPRAAERGVAFVPGGAFHPRGLGQDHLRLNFTLHRPDRIREGIGRLSEVIGASLADAGRATREMDLEMRPIV